MDEIKIVNKLVNSDNLYDELKNYSNYELIGIVAFLIGYVTRDWKELNDVEGEGE